MPNRVTSMDVDLNDMNLCHKQPSADAGNAKFRDQMQDTIEFWYWYS